MKNDNKNVKATQADRDAATHAEMNREDQVPTAAQAVADEANKTGIRPGDMIPGGDLRTVTTPDAAITAAHGNVVTTESDNRGVGGDIPPVPESQKEKFDRVMEDVSKLLARTPQGMSIHLVKEGDRHFYRWGDTSNDALKAREEARKKLEELYQSGAYSYSQFAERLRLTNADVTALLDVDWREKQGVV